MSKLLWPVPGITTISSAYGLRNGQIHTGIDIAAPTGTPVVAAADGKVILANDVYGYGNAVFIQHQPNLYTRYAHLSRIDVATGQQVQRGQRIGLSGGQPGTPGAGTSTGPHLHFEVRNNNPTWSSEPGHLDPMPYLTIDQPGKTWMWLGLAIFAGMLFFGTNESD